MSNFTILDKNKHQNLRVITDRGAEFGEATHLLPVIVEELNQLMLEYPVCLLKSHETGQFGLHALLGFEQGENLYLNNKEWSANYLPAHIRRQPFMVSVNGKAGEQPSPSNTVITINEDSPRVQETSGESLFDEQGELTPYMRSINDVLAGLMNGIVKTDAFINVIAELDLIESIQLTVSFADGEEKRFDGLFTINESKLKSLNSEEVNTLHNNGYLQACYLIIASMGHVQKLISLKRARLNNQ